MDLDPLYSTDDLHSEAIWIISICGAKTMENYPIMGVARGTPSFGGLAWNLSSDSVGTWRWNYIEEFDTNRLMPIDEGQDAEPISTEPFLINQALGLLLEKFWLLATSGELEFENYPCWLDFLEWVHDYG